MTEIVDTLFDPNEAEARAKLLLRLASHPGEPVADVELIFAVGSISVFRRALTRLCEEGERENSPFVIQRGEGACALRRRR
jgi:hypothetical protein